jgi:cytosol aminopeptidase
MPHTTFAVVPFQTSSTKRNMSSTLDALVLLVPPKEFPVVPSHFSSSLNAQALWSSTRAKYDKALETRLFHQETGPTLSFVALGKEGSNENARREAARKAVATGVKAARNAGARTIGIVSDKISAHDAGKGCFLAQTEPMS